MKVQRVLSCIEVAYSKDYNFPLRFFRNTASGIIFLRMYVAQRAREQSVKEKGNLMLVPFPLRGTN